MYVSRFTRFLYQRFVAKIYSAIDVWHTIRLLIFVFPLLLIACGPATTAVPLPIPVHTEIAPIPPTQEPIVISTPVVVTATPEPLDPIILPISVYILDEASGDLSSKRTAVELESVFTQVNEIWAQAGVTLDVQTWERIVVPTNIAQAIVNGDFDPFFAAAERDFPIPNPSLLNAFYAQGIGGFNGVAPFGTRLFFVTDEPTVHDERVTSHEIGHILGLHHTLQDENRLMFSGTNGINLTEEEITVARYAAKGLLARTR